MPGIALAIGTSRAKPRNLPPPPRQMPLLLPRPEIAFPIEEKVFLCCVHTEANPRFNSKRSRPKPTPHPQKNDILFIHLEGEGLSNHFFEVLPIIFIHKARIMPWLCVCVCVAGKLVSFSDDFRCFPARRGTQ